MHIHTHTHIYIHLIDMLILGKLGHVLPIWFTFFCTVNSYFVATEELALTESMLVHRK